MILCPDMLATGLNTAPIHNIKGKKGPKTLSKSCQLLQIAVKIVPILKGFKGKFVSLLGSLEK